MDEDKKRFIAVKFNITGKVYHYLCPNEAICKADFVVVESERFGKEFAHVEYVFWAKLEEMQLEPECYKTLDTRATGSDLEQAQQKYYGYKEPQAARKVAKTPPKQAPVQIPASVKSAQVLFQKLRQEEPDAEKLRVKLIVEGRHLIDVRNWEDAAALYDLILQNYPDDFEARGYRIILIYLAKTDKDSCTRMAQMAKEYSTFIKDIYASPKEQRAKENMAFDIFDGVYQICVEQFIRAFQHDKKQLQKLDYDFLSSLVNNALCAIRLSYCVGDSILHYFANNLTLKEYIMRAWRDFMPIHQAISSLDSVSRCSGKWHDQTQRDLIGGIRDRYIAFFKEHPELKPADKLQAQSSGFDFSKVLNFFARLTDKPFKPKTVVNNKRVEECRCLVNGNGYKFSFAAWLELLHNDPEQEAGYALAFSKHIGEIFGKLATDAALPMASQVAQALEFADAIDNYCRKMVNLPLGEVNQYNFEKYLHRLKNVLWLHRECNYNLELCYGENGQVSDFLRSSNEYFIPWELVVQSDAIDNTYDTMQFKWRMNGILAKNPSFKMPEPAIEIPWPHTQRYKNPTQFQIFYDYAEVFKLAYETYDKQRLKARERFIVTPDIRLVENPNYVPNDGYKYEQDFFDSEEFWLWVVLFWD